MGPSSLHLREMLQISPIPKHMHPLHDAKRREARAKALGRTLKEEEGVAYVDAAEYKGKGAMAAAVVNGDGHLVASCSVKTDDPETAEERCPADVHRIFVLLGMVLTWTRMEMLDMTGSAASAKCAFPRTTSCFKRHLNDLTGNLTDLTKKQGAALDAALTNYTK
ncbi:hypothetical protein HPB47_003290 [Ixodes persulcatus]|uniref:Uncharacterized protein n=1 Tax=Ixodes persulcatus TaxID=34615 RepID=A0AC60PIU3_IXOPE|nr:hypothetical protein HPB47_003290 [Ixodes persulcatus]